MAHCAASSFPALALNKILLQIAAELKVRPAQVNAAVELLDGGATVPFISRYRKEATEGLDDTQLRELEARLSYLRELEERRAAVLKSIEEQGKLTPALRAAIEAAPTKQELEDLYLPFKVKRRTKAMIAREAGIEPLADKLFADPSLDPLAEAAAFINAEAGFADEPAVLDGVRDILSERWAEDALLVRKLREWLWEEGQFQSKLLDGKDANNPDVSKFRDYFDYAEPIRTVPSHRALAVFRGRTLSFWMRSCRRPMWLQRKPRPALQPTWPAARPSPRRGSPPPSAWPKAASPCTWPGATAPARPTT